MHINLETSREGILVRNNPSTSILYKSGNFIKIIAQERSPLDATKRNIVTQAERNQLDVVQIGVYSVVVTLRDITKH